MVKFILKLWNNIISTNRWTLKLKDNEKGYFIDLEQPSNLARADNFMVAHENKVYVFFEEFIIEKNRKGYLSVGELDSKTHSLVNVKKILEHDYHLSYPFIFNLNDEWYMIPETHSNNTIDLYKFIEFPYKLEKVRTLITDIDAVDSTLLYKDNVYYLFCNIKEGNIPHNNNLSIYYTDDLLNGKFLPHPMNPIKIGNKYSRMAGAILYENANYYRFAQNCSFIYGSNMFKFLIEELTPEKYKEVLVDKVCPPKGCHATHTYSKCGKYELLDVIKYNYSLNNISRNLIRLSKKIINR